MASLRSVLAAGLLLLSTTANAHFELQHPSPLTAESSSQATAPCGGANADIDQNTATDFHVEGDYVQLFNGHAQGNWLIRGTLDPKAGGDWEQLFPIVQQTGRGNFCEPVVTVPGEWAGKKGFLGISGNAGDGILYAVCAKFPDMSRYLDTLTQGTVRRCQLRVWLRASPRRLLCQRQRCHGILPAG